MPDKVAKPYGGEIILSPADAPYTSKILMVNAGERSSLQYHDKKVETLTLFSGKGTMTTGKDIEHLITEDMILLKPFHITPGLIHQYSAITDIMIFEASSKETGTTVRLEDDYNRPNETEKVRDLPNRGWTPPQNENS